MIHVESTSLPFGEQPEIKRCAPDDMTEAFGSHWLLSKMASSYESRLQLFSLIVFEASRMYLPAFAVVNITRPMIRRILVETVLVSARLLCTFDPDLELSGRSSPVKHHTRCKKGRLRCATPFFQTLGVDVSAQPISEPIKIAQCSQQPTFLWLAHLSVDRGMHQTDDSRSGISSGRKRFVPQRRHTMLDRPAPRTLWTPVHLARPEKPSLHRDEEQFSKTRYRCASKTGRLTMGTKQPRQL